MLKKGTDQARLREWMSDDTDKPQYFMGLGEHAWGKMNKPGGRPKGEEIEHVRPNEGVPTDSTMPNKLDDSVPPKPAPNMPPRRQSWDKKIFNFLSDVKEGWEGFAEEAKYQWDSKVRGVTDTPETDEYLVSAHAAGKRALEEGRKVSEGLSFGQLVEGFDPRNTDSVKALQSLLGIESDGIFGPESRRALSEYLMAEGETISQEALSKFDVGPESHYAEYIRNKDKYGIDDEGTIRRYAETIQETEEGGTMEGYPETNEALRYPPYKTESGDGRLPDEPINPDRPLPEMEPSKPDRYEERPMPLEEKLIKDLEKL